jgi:hypothetical protein
MGFRDHSWGPRRAHTVRNSRWANGTVGPHLSWCLLGGQFESGEFYRWGYIVEDGVPSMLRDWSLSVSLDIDGMTWHGACGRMVTDDGRLLPLRYEGVFDAMLMPLDSLHLVETGCRAVVDGAVGVGNVEQVTNPYGGTSTPASALNVCLEDGLSRRATGAWEVHA